MGRNKSLRLPGRLKLTLPSLSYPGHLMGLLCSVILILFGAVNCLKDLLPMRYAIAA